MTETDPVFGQSRIYDPVALLRKDGEVLYVARVGMKASQRFMILTPQGDPAWPHEPLASLSDVGWALRAHGWHLVPVEPIGENARPVRTLSRLMLERA